jgi:predicted transcriptional regulator
VDTYVFSIKSVYAEQIFAGTKEWELRRGARRSLVPGTRVLVYETSPVQEITGEFVVAELEIGPPTRIARLTGLPGARQYLKGATQATALRVSEVCQYRRPMLLEEIGIRQAPMSYACVPVRVRHRQCM